MKKALSTVHQVLCMLLLVVEIVEFFFAGMGVFHATNFQIHRATGEIIWFGALFLLLLSLVGWMGRKTISYSALLFVLMFIQSMLVNLHQPFIAALHPVNGLAILVTTFVLIRNGSRKMKDTV